MQSSWDSPQPPFYQCNETGKILDIMSRNPPVGDRKVITKKMVTKMVDLSPLHPFFGGVTVLS